MLRVVGVYLKPTDVIFVITRSSVFECVAILDVLKDNNIISQKEFESLENQAVELSRILYAMIINLSEAY